MDSHLASFRSETKQQQPQAIHSYDRLVGFSSSNAILGADELAERFRPRPHSKMKRAVSAPKMGSFWWVQNGSYFGGRFGPNFWGRFGPRFLGHNDPNFRAESAQERGQNQIDRGRFGFREGRFGFPRGSKQPHKKNGPITNGPMKRANLAQLWAINYHTRSCMESTLFTHKARNVAKALYWYHQDSHQGNSK